MRLVFEEDGKWVALMVWGSACYKAAGWTPLGRTQGFTRVNRQDCDFYVPNDRPKAVWVKPLGKDALELLNARTLPEDCTEGARGDARGVMPLGTEGEKGRCEMPVGRKLFGRMDLSNALVSSDALHCQQDTYPPPQASRRGWLQGVPGRSSARAAST